MYVNGISCYGTLEENSNLQISCENEEFDFVWTGVSDISEKPFKTWKEVVKFFKHYDGNVIQIEAI